MFNLLKNSFIIFSLFFCFNIYGDYVDNTQALKDYIKQLMTDSMGMLDNENLSLDEKVSKAKASLIQNMDFDSMSKQSLGRSNYNRISDQQFSQYKEAYKNYLVNVYSRAVNSYNDQIMNIKSVTQIASNQYLVRTEIVSHKTEQKISVEFYVKSTQSSDKETFKVLDIVTEGISLIQTQQTQFNSVIESSNIEALIKMLESK
jgi:phospholipid transport system substrate-binding protein